MFDRFFHSTFENTFSQNVFNRKSNFTQPRNTDSDLDNQTDILNNLDLELRETCSKNNLSKMEQSEYSKLISDMTIVIKPADEEEKEQLFLLNILKN